jgi:very-short-patch-repair endonuclease
VGVIHPNRTDMRGGTLVRDRARRLRRDMANAERALWRALRKGQLGGRSHRQFPIPPFVVDFACIEVRLIIECDGGQHADSRSDVQRDAYLRRQGWRILRFWNNNILNNLPGVTQTIAAVLGEQCETPTPHPDPPPLAGEGVPPATYDVASPPPQAGED